MSPSPWPSLYIGHALLAPLTAKHKKERRFMRVSLTESLAPPDKSVCMKGKRWH
jgi:hypothetical protein